MNKSSEISENGRPIWKMKLSEKLIWKVGDGAAIYN